MTDTAADDPVVQNPTYMGNIRYFFRPDDIDHMRKKGIELGTYQDLKTHAGQVYSATSGGWMPPDVPWSANRCQTFLNWITNKFPMGTSLGVAQRALLGTASASRIRKDVASLTADEQQALTKAFSTLMSRDKADPTGYFAVAGIHGLPGAYCQHHNDPFNPWHRFYLKTFEDLLRGVPGCENVTLPYWDISKPIPPLLQSGPLASFTLPQGVSSQYPAGYTTQRYAQAQIDSNLQMFDFFGDTSRSLAQTRWGAYRKSGYQLFSIQAHDSGHNSIGPTMADQDVASYDPIFWFYHCNLDRFWLSWQKTLHATDWSSFQTLLDNLQFWQQPLSGISMQPWTATTDETIAFDIDYEDPAVTDRPLENRVRSLAATSNFTIKSDDEIAVRVEDVRRLNVPGSFVVHLLADGEVVASRAFFQPSSPRGCATCATIPEASFEFRLSRDKVLDKKLSVKLEVPSQEAIGAGFPLSSVGSPTIRANLLLDEV